MVKCTPGIGSFRIILYGINLEYKENTGMAMLFLPMQMQFRLQIG
jgi:hypothetical protein